MAKIEYKNVTKYFGQVKVLENLNLTINDGELVVIVGPSGCGKSTFLRLLAGLEEITSGDILMNGKRVNNIAPKDRDISMVFQNYALYPHMTVYKNMAFGLKLKKYKKEEIDKRVRETSEILGLENFLYRKPKQLSGGQRQRVALGRAIVRKPSAFLFDEPLSNLDAKLRTQMRTEIKKLHADLKTTMIYVTHDQTEAMTMGDRIVVMQDGYIHQIGTPMEVYNHPKDLFVAGFVGSPTMNFLDFQVGDDVLFNDNTGITLKIPKKHFDRLNLEDVKDVVLGIRPEDISMAKNDSCVGPVGVKIDLIEPLGNETLVYFKLNDKTIICKEDSYIDHDTGQPISIYFKSDKIHYFDSQNSKVIER